MRAAEANPDKFDVFTHETMPERYHFSNNERIAPIYVIPKIGYSLTNHKDGDAGIPKGVSTYRVVLALRSMLIGTTQTHGYDNNEPSMHAMFVAHGPFSAVTKAVHQYRTRGIHQMFLRSLPRPNKGWHSTSDDTYVMNGFQNVEIYNLVMKLFGIEDDSSERTNGTTGFWDLYF